jgi:hypothetical protein
MPKLLCAVLLSADGQPAIDTQWSAKYQKVIDGGADAFEQWLAAAISLPDASFMPSEGLFND